MRKKSQPPRGTGLSNGVKNLQNEIYRKMSAKKKVEILSQMFLLGKELSRLKFKNDAKKTSSKDSKNLRRS